MTKKSKLTADELTKFKKDKIMKAGGLWAVFDLINRYFWKSGFGPFFTFLFPILIYGILGSLMDPDLMYGGIVAMTSLSVGLQGLPFQILELKNSVLLKRIGASPISTSKFTIAVISHSLITVFASIILMTLAAMIMFSSTSMLSNLSGIFNFLSFLYGNVLNIILSLTLGFAIAAVSKNDVQASAIGGLIYMPATMLSGQFISIDVISNSEVMTWISKMLPFRYTAMYIIAPTIEGIDNPFVFQDISGPSIPTLGELAEFIKDEKLVTFTTDGQENIKDLSHLISLIEKSKEDPNILFDVKYIDGARTLQLALVPNSLTVFFMNSSTFYHASETIIGHIYPATAIVITAAFAGWKFNWG